MDLELCRKFFASRRNFTIFAGFSGGADSTAALLTALYFRQEFDLQIVAVHFNHHLRGEESEADAAWCRCFAEKSGICFRQIDLELSSTGAVEDIARQARLFHWQELAGNRRDCAVMLGHHADDRMENFFLRLLRGSNLSGLLSPRAEYKLHGVDFFRPLLCFSRKEIEAFLQQNKIDDWRIDSTNKKNDCSRNILRNIICPELFKLFPGAGPGIAQSLKVLEQDADFIETCASERFDLDKINTRSYWRQLHPALAVRILRLWKNEIPSADFISRFQKELMLDPPSGVRKIPWHNTQYLCFQNENVYWEMNNSPSGCTEQRWQLEKKFFVWGDWIFKAEPADSTMVSSKYEAVFDAESLGPTLLISLPSPGERMTVFGTNRSEKVKKLRVDSKIPAHYMLPVVRNSSGKIVWAPGVRHSALAAAGKDSGCLVRLSVKSAKFGVGVGID